MPIPGVNPYVAPTVICPQCGEKLEPQFQKGKGAKIPEVQYVCINEASKCAYKVVLSLEHMRGECLPLKPEEVTKIKEEAVALAEVTKGHDEAVRELIRLLPSLKIVARAVESDQGPGDPAAVNEAPAPVGA